LLVLFTSETPAPGTGEKRSDENETGNNKACIFIFSPKDGKKKKIRLAPV